MLGNSESFLEGVPGLIGIRERHEVKDKIEELLLFCNQGPDNQIVI